MTLFAMVVAVLGVAESSKCLYVVECLYMGVACRGGACGHEEWLSCMLRVLCQQCQGCALVQRLSEQAKPQSQGCQIVCHSLQITSDVKHGVIGVRVVDG